jgi:hypothetical protein
MGLDTKTYWLTDRQSQRDFDFGLTKSELRELDLGSREYKDENGACPSDL